MTLYCTTHVRSGVAAKVDTDVRQRKNIYSDILNQMVRLKISTKAIKSIECAGGFDKYIVSIPNKKLSSKALKLKKAIKTKIIKSPEIKKKISEKE